MAAFTSLALGLAAAGLLAAKKKPTEIKGDDKFFGGNKWANTLLGNKTPNQMIAAQQAKNAASAQATADATTPAPPPSTSALASSGVASARTAADRQRKRAAAGSTLASGGIGKGSGATARLAPRTLIGA